jgi:hypothetical protein
VLCRNDNQILEWIRQARWFKGVSFRKGNDLEGNPAIEFRFAPGAFWAIRTKVLRLLDWPDPRLIQADEDFLLGEALRQNAFRVENFNYGVAVNDAQRRNADAQTVPLQIGRES